MSTIFKVVYSTMTNTVMSSAEYTFSFYNNSTKSKIVGTIISVFGSNSDHGVILSPCSVIQMVLPRGYPGDAAITIAHGLESHDVCLIPST